MFLGGSPGTLASFPLPRTKLAKWNGLQLITSPAVNLSMGLELGMDMPNAKMKMTLGKLTMQSGISTERFSELGCPYQSKSNLWIILFQMANRFKLSMFNPLIGFTTCSTDALNYWLVVFQNWKIKWKVFGSCTGTNILLTQCMGNTTAIFIVLFLFNSGVMRAGAQNVLATWLEPLSHVWVWTR